MDIKIFDEISKTKFKFRVNGVLIVDGKILTVEMNKSGNLCCPGGHVTLDEDTMSAMQREFFEETGIEIKVNKLLAIIENFFGFNGKYHELSFYYSVEPKSMPADKQKDFSLIENDKGVLVDMQYRWIKLEELSNYNFNPKPLRDKLINKNFDFQHIIFKENQ